MATIPCVDDKIGALPELSGKQRVVVCVEGDYGQRRAAVLVLRNAGLTRACPYCRQGVIERRGVIRDRCRICKRKVVRLSLVSEVDSCRLRVA